MLRLLYEYSAAPAALKSISSRAAGFSRTAKSVGIGYWGRKINLGGRKICLSEISRQSAGQ